GANPGGYYTPVLDKQGNLYGTTISGGAYNLGTVWKLTPSGTETVLWSFGNGTDGSVPVGVVPDGSGNLYGTTNTGGTYNLGTAFEVTPSGTETVLWNFGNGTDGSYPVAEPVLDRQGNVYATTAEGGTSNKGTLVKIAPSGTETVLWNFAQNTEAAPRGFMLAGNGNFYGTTYGWFDGAGADPSPVHAPEGNGYYGTVWELTPSGTETVLWRFDPIHRWGQHLDGGLPTANVVMDENGILFGTTHWGGDYEDGTAFALPTAGNNTARAGRDKVIHTFHRYDGPYSNTLLYNGDLYSTTYTDSPQRHGGTVWKMTESGKQTILHRFAHNNRQGDGFGPATGVVVDGNGNVYGTTQWGGGTACQAGGEIWGCGTIYKVTP
ncbi:MAG TPA: choice-of-anchor tandem repeat GloVer-containing protein, partial [Rhizomicrobium sp.]|nr:choice-of-anchor tandem repeat GloVer-containing protein [Rhizomicrobium sp.]